MTKVTMTDAVRADRYKRIIAMHEQGMTYAAIGATFDPPIGKARVQQIATSGGARPIGRPKRAAGGVTDPS